jgi:hypothetical protein
MCGRFDKIRFGAEGGFWLAKHKRNPRVLEGGGGGGGYG